MSKGSLQTDHIREFLAQAEHYRALLQETGRSAALMRRVERGRGGVTQEDDEALRTLAPGSVSKR